MNEKKLLIFDTSSLLNIFSYSEKSVEQILSYFVENREEIWIPKQVELEFKKNSLERGFAKIAIKNYDALNRSLTGIFLTETKTKIKNILDNYKKWNYEDIDKLEKDLAEKLNETKEIIDLYNRERKANIEKNKDIHSKNRVEEVINGLKIGENFSMEERIKNYEEGEKRYRFKIPPGYEDNKKDYPEKFGDLFIWKQILKKCENLEGIDYIYFISDDLKEDWLDGNQLRGELLDELNAINSKINIEYMKLCDFLKNIENKKE